MTEPLLSVRDLVVTYDGRRVLDGVDLDVRRGEVLGVVGESGGGKTTLALALAGAVPDPGRAAGAITYRPDGDPVDVLALEGRARRRFRARRVAVVAGEPADVLPPGERVRRHVEAVCRDAGVDPSAGRDRAARAVERFGRDADRVLDARTDALDDGARRAAAVAAAAAPGPDVLVCDQPPLRYDALARRWDAGAFADALDCALVLVGADSRAVAALAERLAVLYGGRIVETGAPGELADAADHPFTRRLFRPFDANA